MNDITIRRAQIIGTRWVVYSAWEPTSGSPMQGFAHTSIRSNGNGGWIGRVGTRKLPGDVYKFPPGLQRAAVAKQHREEDYARAYDAIRGAYPWLPLNLSYKADFGQIEVRENLIDTVPE